MKLDLSADRIFFNRRRKNKLNKTKLRLSELSMLATEARTGIDENNHLSSSIDILKRMVKNNKTALNKLFSYKKLSINDAQKHLNEEKQELLLLNKNLKGEKNYMRLKYTKTKNEINQTLSNLKAELDILVNRKFMCENALSEKESIIRKIKNTLKEYNTLTIKFSLIKEEEIYLNINDSEVELDDMLERAQLELMVECKNFNKYQNKYISLIERKNLLYEEISKIRNKGNKKINKKKQFETIYEDIEKLAEEDSLLNESIASIYEEDLNNMEFPKVVLDKCIIDKKKLDTISKVPQLSMEQINYNKKRYKPEDAEKSLSRVIVNQDSNDLKIKKMKNDIKKIKKKVRRKERKCKKFEEKIKKMENFLEEYDKLLITDRSSDVNKIEQNILCIKNKILE
jgi:hypothetical protein